MSALHRASRSTRRRLRRAGAAVAGVVTASAAIALAFGTPAPAATPAFTAQTNPRITYPNAGTSQAEFHVAADGGVLNVRNGSEPNPLFAYTVQVQCSSMVGTGPNAVVYFAGPVIESHGVNNILGEWLFAGATAGGPGLGTVSGQLAPYGSCYDGTNGALTGPPFTLSTGAISITPGG